MTGTLEPAIPEPDDTAGHILPADVWEEVVAGAEQRAAVLERPQVGMAAPDRTITARSHGGLMDGGPRLGVIHSAETPLQAGYAYAIAANWFAVKATTSATVMIDPAETIRMLPDNVVAYHVGPAGNGFSVGVEQAGRASLTRAQWLTGPALAQMDRVATYMRECRDRWGIPLRWATDDQIRAAKAGGPAAGWCTHDDVRRVLGGTTHTDPGGAYPRAELMARALGTAGEDDEMSAADTQMLRDILAELMAARRQDLVVLSGKVSALQTALGVADANDSPEALVKALTPALTNAVTTAVQKAVAGGGITDTDQLRGIVDAAVRGVFADAGGA